MLIKSFCIAIAVVLRQHSQAIPGPYYKKWADTVRHIISILLQNEAGALARVANLFSSRGYNIESLNVAPTYDETVSRLTLVTTGSDDVIDQITKQLAKLIDVVNIINMTKGDHIERELVLFKLKLDVDDKDELMSLVSQFGGRILDDHAGHFTVELLGGSGEVDRFISGLSVGVEILTVVRSGAMAVARGAPLLTPG